MSEWNRKKIGDLFEYTVAGEWGHEPTGFGDVPVIRSTNFRNSGKLDLSEIVYRSVPAEKLSTRTVKQGDILIEKSGGSPAQPAGRIVLCDTEFTGTCSNFIEVAKVRKELDSRFIFYSLYYNYLIGKVLPYQQQTTGIINFKLGEYADLESINLPADPAEQSRIARILSTVDEAIEQTEALIAKYNRIRTGLMQDLLTRGIDEQGRIRSEATHAFKDSPLGRMPVEWEVTNLKQALHCIEAGKSPNCPDIPAGMHQWGVLKVSAVGAKGFIESENKVILEEKFVNQRYQVKSGDLLMTRANTAELVGLVCIVGGVSSQLLLSDKTLRLIANEERADKRFIMTVLKSPAVRRQIEIEATGSSASMKNISQSNIFNLTVALPDVMEQKRISDKIQKVDAALSSKREHLHKLQTLKKGLMQDLLAGPKGHEEVS